MASSSEAIPATQRGQSGQLTYQFWAANSRIPNTGRRAALDAPRARCYVGPVAKKSFTVECPACRAKLTLDPELRAVIAHEPPPPTRTVEDLGAALDKLRSRSAQIEERFRQAVEAEGN